MARKVTQRKLLRDKQVIDLWSNGSAIKKIMRLCELSYSGVYSILDKHSVPRNKPGKKDYGTQLELFED